MTGPVYDVACILPEIVGEPRTALPLKHLDPLKLQPKCLCCESEAKRPRAMRMAVIPMTVDGCHTDDDQLVIVMMMEIIMLMMLMMIMTMMITMMMIKMMIMMVMMMIMMIM